VSEKRWAGVSTGGLSKKTEKWGKVVNSYFLGKRQGRGGAREGKFCRKKEGRKKKKNRRPKSLSVDVGGLLRPAGSRGTKVRGATDRGQKVRGGKPKLLGGERETPVRNVLANPHSIKGGGGKGKG